MLTFALRLQLGLLIGDVFLAAACVSYFGAFTGSYRRELLQSWMEHLRQACIPFSLDFSLAGVLADPVQVREWQLASLPTDSVSVENAVLVLDQKRWPMLIDPQVSVFEGGRMAACTLTISWQN